MFSDKIRAVSLYGRFTTRFKTAFIMDTIGKLTHLKEIVSNVHQVGSHKNMVEIITSDPMFMVSGLRYQRDQTGAIRPYFMRSWGKNALKLFLGISSCELELILCAENSEQAIRIIDDIIRQYHSQSRQPGQQQKHMSG